MWIYWKDEVLCVSANISVSWEFDTLQWKPKSQDFENDILRCIFLNENFTAVCSEGSSQQLVISSLGKGLHQTDTSHDLKWWRLSLMIQYQGSLH